MNRERARIDRIARAFGGRTWPDVLLGIGDDAAVLRSGADALVWTVDASVEGTHFRRAWLAMSSIGYRATMAAASDLAAMGASPLGLLASLILPADFSDDDLDELLTGQREAADAIGAPIVGGNLARGSELSITTTALGRAKHPIGRDGAEAGDAIWIAGPVGLAAAGLVVLERGLDVTTSVFAPAVAAFSRPFARIADGLTTASIAHAAIDVSDGLAGDVAHLARAADLIAVLDPNALVEPALTVVARALDRDALSLALYGGEDYALVVAAPSDAELPGFVRAGCFITRPHDFPPEMHVALQAQDERLVPVPEGGFDHFAARATGTATGR
jgi:thiamine-monophosphate kinase